MIITTIEGIKLDTDKLSDLDSFIYEKMHKDIGDWNQFGCSFLTIVKIPGKETRITSAFNFAEKVDLLLFISYLKDHLEKQTDKKYTLEIKPVEPLGESESESWKKE